MADSTLRFLHAGAFRLDEPLDGLSDPPAEWLDLLADAPYTAAQHVFATAMAEEVDFLLLVGRLLDPHRAGPRGMAFLLDQFEQLAAKEIAVYWAASDLDHWEKWPSGCQQPRNLHVFAHGHVEEVTHIRGGEPLATLLGRSGGSGGVRGADFSADFSRYTIGMACGQPDKKSLSRHSVDYWALSGQSTRETYFSKPRHAHDAGSPQGRSELETGPHGCTMVRVAGGRTTITPVAGDAVRWNEVTIEAPRPATLETLESAMSDQIRRLSADADRPQLVVWNVEGIERVEGVGRDGKWRRELASRLRKKHATVDNGVWTVRIDAVLPEAPPEQWLEENTMLGDFLRELHEYSFRDDAERALRNHLAELGISSDIHEFCDLSDREERDRVLREASKLGADLLRGNA
ncbi:MAG: hypothetical protein KDB14_33695 [Planctomycetales bacterium]|nr:hypothetical protein [Planctomycetales bacterium]